MSFHPLELLAAKAMMEGGMSPCKDGHHWKHIGGKNCGCHEYASCSVPVYECELCGDCDYGDNDDAHDKKRMCEQGVTT